MKTPDFVKMAEDIINQRLFEAETGCSIDAHERRIAAALRKVHTDALESAAKHLESHGCYQTAATIRALATKEDGNVP